MSDQTTADTALDLPKVSTERTDRHDLPTGVLHVVVDPQDERHVYAACMDGVYAIDLERGGAQKLYEHQSYASGVARDPARAVLISAGYDGQLIWYDLERMSVFRRVQAHRFWSWKIDRSPDGHFVASVSGQYLAGGERYEPAPEHEPSVKLYDVATGNLIHAFSHLPPVQSVAISSDNRFVAAGNLMGDVRVWDCDTGDLVAQWTTEDFTSWGIIKSHCYIGGIYALRFDPKSHELIAAGMGPMRDPMAGNGRQLWQRFAWQEEPVRQVDETHEGESGEGLMEALACHPHEPVFLMGGRLRGGEWNAALFSLTHGHRLHHLNTGYRLTSAAFTNNGQQLVLGGTDKQKPPKNGKHPPFGVVERFQITGQTA